MVTRPVVMAIDDNLPVLQLYKAALGSEGYEVKTLSSSDSYPEWDDYAPFDVLITEYKLDGLETLPIIEEVKLRYPNTYVILATKHNLADGAYAPLFENGVDDVIIKPFSIQVLTAIIQKGLRTRRSN